MECECLPKSGWTAAFLICLTLVDVLIIEFTIGLATYPDNHPWIFGDIILLWIVAILIAITVEAGPSFWAAVIMTLAVVVFNSKMAGWL